MVELATTNWHLRAGQSHSAMGTNANEHPTDGIPVTQTMQRNSSRSMMEPVPLALQSDVRHRSLSPIGGHRSLSSGGIRFSGSVPPQGPPSPTTGIGITGSAPGVSMLKDSILASTTPGATLTSADLLNSYGNGQNGGVSLEEQEMLRWLKSELTNRFGNLTIAFERIDDNKTQILTVTKLARSLSDFGVSRRQSEALFRRLTQLAQCERLGVLSLQDWLNAFHENHTVGTFRAENPLLTSLDSIIANARAPQIETSWRSTHSAPAQWQSQSPRSSSPPRAARQPSPFREQRETSARRYLSPGANAAPPIRVQSTPPNPNSPRAAVPTAPVTAPF